MVFINFLQGYSVLVSSKVLRYTRKLVLWRSPLNFTAVQMYSEAVPKTRTPDTSSTDENLYYHQYTRPNSKLPSSKHLISGHKRPCAGGKFIYRPAPDWPRRRRTTAIAQSESACKGGAGLKPRPNDRNMPTQHIATLLGATCCVRLATVLRCVGCCWLKFDQLQT